MTDFEYEPTAHDLRMAEEADRDRRRATERGLAGVQRHEMGGETAQAETAPSGALREAVAVAIYEAAFDRGPTAYYAMADAAIQAMADFPHKERT